MTAAREMTAIGRNSSSKGGIFVSITNKPPTGLFEIKYIQEKDVLALINRVKASFCLFEVFINHGYYRCRSPPLLTF